MTGDPTFVDEIHQKRDAVVYPALADAAKIYPASSAETKAINGIVAGYKTWATARDAELKQYSTDTRLRSTSPSARTATSARRTRARSMRLLTKGFQGSGSPLSFQPCFAGRLSGQLTPDRTPVITL